jgi:hypothetical protein
MNELDTVQHSTGEMVNPKVPAQNNNNTNSFHNTNIATSVAQTQKIRRKMKKGKTKINRYISKQNKINAKAVSNINNEQEQRIQLNNNELSNSNIVDNESTNNNNTQHNNNIVGNNTINNQLTNNDILPTPTNNQPPIGDSRQLINEEKGDNLDYKPDNHLRFIFQNIDKWAATTRQIYLFLADVVGFCETCTNWKNRELKKRFQISANKSLKNPIISTTTTTLNYDGDYVPGGCCQLTANSWTTRHESVIYDSFRHGRWVGNTYRLSTEKQLHIVTAYRVCEQQPNATNSMSTSTQQHIMLTA